MATYQSPTDGVMSTQDALRDVYIANASPELAAPRRTSASLGGVKSQDVTAYDIATVLQGSLGIRDKTDSMLIFNAGLTEHLDHMAASDAGTVSIFSNKQRVPLLSSGIMQGGTGAPGEAMFNYTGGVLDGHVVAQLAYAAGFRGDYIVLVVAISHRESRWDPSAFNKNEESRDLSYGLMQINMKNDDPGNPDMGTKRLAQFGLSNNEQLFDPLTNLKSAFILTVDGTNFRPWGGYKGEEDNYNTDMGTAKKIVDSTDFSTAALAASGITFSGGTANYSGGTPGGYGSVGQTAPVNISEAAILYASQKVGSHPNNWLWHSGGRDKTRQLFMQGITGGATKHAIYKYGDRGYLMPALLNYLWLIMEYGFTIVDSGDTLVNKSKNSRPGAAMSNHSLGGGMDIFALAHPDYNNGRYINYKSRDWRKICDRFYGFLQTLPKEQIAQEHGNSYAHQYPSLKVYQDGNPNHIHIGFSADQTLNLIPPLQKPGSSSTSTNRTSQRRFLNIQQAR